MQAMKSLNILATLINRELGPVGLYLSKIDAPISQEDEWVWFFCLFTGKSSFEEVEQISSLILELMSPLRVGEVIGHSCNTSIFIAENDCLPIQVQRSEILPFSSPYVASLLDSMSDVRPSLFFRIKKEGILDAYSISKTLCEETWFRSQAIPSRLRGRSIDISFGASHTALQAQRKDILSCFETEKGFYAVFHNNSSDGKVRCNIYQASGLIEILNIGREDFLVTIGFSNEEAYGFNPNVPLQIDLSTEGSNLLTMDSVLEDIKASTITCEKCREIVATQLDSDRRLTLRRLETRRETLRSRRTVFVLNKGQELPLGYEPSNETELIILATKLEPYLKEYFGEFQILEHTSQLGIDSLIKIRRTSSSILEISATAEFEYELGNFFKHEHPIEQTNYVLCWTIGNISDGKRRFGKRGLIPGGEIKLDVSSASWLKIFTFNTHMIYVLPLENFPSLIVRN